jgi:hypothetical protein
VATQNVTVLGSTGVQAVITDNGSSGPVQTATVGQAVTLSGAGSSTQLGSIVSYLWTLGDGGSAVTQGVTHVFAAAGSYIVKLQVTDSYGQSSTTSMTIVVQPSAGSGSGGQPSGTGGGGGGSGNSSVAQSIQVTFGKVFVRGNQLRVEYKVAGSSKTSAGMLKIIEAATGKRRASTIVSRLFAIVPGSHGKLIFTMTPAQARTVAHRGKRALAVIFVGR